MYRRRFLLGAGACVAAGQGLAAGDPVQVSAGMLDAGLLGLVPNSDHDQSAKLGTCLQAANDMGVALYIPAGTYLISDVRLPDGTQLIGAYGQSLFKRNDPGRIVFAKSAHSLGLKAMRFEGPGQKIGVGDVGLVDVDFCSQLRIESCLIGNSAGHGISLSTCKGFVRNNRITQCYGAAITSLNGAGMWIENNDISSCGNLGVYVARDEPGLDGTLIRGNRISTIDWKAGGNGQNGNGINIFRANKVIISDNMIIDCGFSAVRLNATNDCQITGNNCFNLSEVAIFSEFGFSGSVIANNIIDQAAQGISITNFDDGGRLAVCANNIVRNIWPASPSNPDTMPVGIAAEADTALTGNIIENVPGIGLSLGWGPYLRDVVANANIIRNCDIGIAVSVVEGVGAASITNNLINAVPGKSAITAMAWDEIVEPDLIGNHARYPKIIMSGNSVSH